MWTISCNSTQSKTDKVTNRISKDHEIWPYTEPLENERILDHRYLERQWNPIQAQLEPQDSDTDFLHC
ncbi:MAG: hypothetical protein J0I15_21935, partial [Herbaspirillum huttiense]|uniref:hypothetical protein n=1 Tax=Herbaspirillum huttiense TaxID=863372 RepID=UPI001AC504B5